MRRPLLVAHNAAAGGSANVLLGLLAHRPPGVEPAVVFLAPGPIEAKARALGAATAVVPGGAARDPRHLPRLVRALRGAIRAHRADVVFAHHAKAHLYAGPAAALERVPALWWHHSRAARERPLATVAERVPAALVVCSSERDAAAQRRRTPGRAVAAVHPGVRVPPVAAVVDPGGRTVGIAGRLQRLKRVDLLLRAAPLVLAAEPAARFAVIGGVDPGMDEDHPAELRALAASLGVAEAVDWEDDVADGPGRIARLDLLAHCCREESFGLVVAEAMAAGVPVVAPDAGGTTESVRSGVDGLLVDVRDARVLAEAIVALLRDPQRRAAMGAAGRARVTERFTERAMADRAWALAAQVAARSAPAPPAGRPGP